MDRMTRQLEGILQRTPNVERMDLQVPREVKSSIVKIVGDHAKHLQVFETNILSWEPEDMENLLTKCQELRHISGHNFTGNILQAIAKSQPLLTGIDCTHPQFDDDELIAFAKESPNLLRLSVLLHQFLTSKALIGVAEHCLGLEYIDFHFCLSLQSNGYQALLSALPHLRFLDLGLTECRDADIILVANRCLGLESLRLPFCGYLTQASIQAVVHSCTKLLHLDISFCDKVMLSIFDSRSSTSSSQSSQSSTSSISSSSPTAVLTPWLCTKLQYLDISGIHSSYAAEASVASALLPTMYHQIGLLTNLRTLKLSGHKFSLHLLDKGRSGLSQLIKLERLDIAKLKEPLPWQDIIEIGNLFPKLDMLQFRSRDVILPSISEKEETVSYNETPSCGNANKRRKAIDQQSVPIYHEMDDNECASNSKENWEEENPTTMSFLDLPTSSTGTVILPTSKPLLNSKRKRSRSPSPTSTKTHSITAEEGSNGQNDEKQRHKKKELPEVLMATLRSGLTISVRLNGEDEDDNQGGLDWA
ncbi:hypothetical protein FBU30_001040 [Linnemannia zychae]|nr:hypothetical protein FBU30_001040 [Linnemannia zychae]